MVWLCYCLTRLLLSPPFTGSRNQGSVLLRGFCDCHHFRTEVFSVCLKLRSAWLVLGGSLWAQDSTLFALCNLWHLYSSLLGLAQSRESESVEGTLKSKMWIYPRAAAIPWGAKSCTRLFCVKQTLLLRTHFFSTFTNSVLLVLTFCTLKI